MKGKIIILSILLLINWGFLVPADNVKFKQVTKAAGLDLEHGSGGHGTASGDLNDDGFIDLVITNTHVPNYIYINKGDKTFTKNSLDSDNYMTHQALLVDIDNDGDLDLVTSSSHIDYPNKLFINDGQGSFTFKSSVLNKKDGKTRGVTASDFNLDGWLDLYGVNFYLPNILFINNSGTLSEKAFIWDCLDYSASKSGSQGVVSADVNQDGLFDIYISKQKTGTSIDQKNVLYINRNGYFENQAAAYGMDMVNNNGATLTDLDNDGDLDLIIANQKSNKSIIIYKNIGNYYVDITDKLNIRGNATGLFSVITGDVNNDGWEDLFMVGYYGLCRLIINKGNWVFQKLEDTGVEVIRDSGRSASFFDYDNDGDLDLAVTCFPKETLFFENISHNNNGYLYLTFFNFNNQRAPFGTKVHLFYNAYAGGEPARFKELISTQAYLSQPSTRMHFGLGSNTPVSLKVKDPNGSDEYVFDIAKDAYLILGKTPKIEIKNSSRTTDNSWLRAFVVDYFDINISSSFGVEEIFVYRKPKNQTNDQFQLVKKITGSTDKIVIIVEEQIEYTYAVFYTTSEGHKSYVTFVDVGNN